MQQYLIYPQNVFVWRSTGSAASQSTLAWRQPYIIYPRGVFVWRSYGSAGAAASFSINPTGGHALGAVSIAATGVSTSWTGSNPFSITVGGSFASISNYVNISATSATFDLNLSSNGGTVTIADSNSGTTQNYAAVAVAPGAPTIGTLTDNHDGTITIAFIAPADDGGATITSYVATTSVGGFNNSGSTSPVTISGITKGSAQHVNVTATNSAGTSASSSNSNTITPVTVPGAPTGLSATATTVGAATVTLVAPTDNGGAAITGYTVSGGGTDTNAGTTTLTHNITGLANATSYTFTATATNSFGTSVASAPSNLITTLGFTISPSTFSTTGVKNITATGYHTTWTGSNPFAIVSGPLSTLTNYVRISGTSATFDVTVTSISGAQGVISDSNSGTNQTITIGGTGVVIFTDVTAFLHVTGFAGITRFAGVARSA